jgi:tetratricopeptide (TPR) repeat protein
MQKEECFPDYSCYLTHERATNLAGFNEAAPFRMNIPPTPSGKCSFLNFGKMRFIAIFLSLTIALGCLQAVAQKPSELAAKAGEAMQQQDYFSAAQYFAEALKKDSSDYRWWYDYAEASRLSNDFVHAERAYKKVSEKDNGKNFPWALFYYGETIKIQGKYKEASKIFEKSFRRFQKKYPPVGVASKRGIEDCTFALAALKNPVEVGISRADSLVNSPGSDLAPLSLKGFLYYSSSGNSTGKNQIRKWKIASREKAFSLRSDTAVHLSSVTQNKSGEYSICSVCKKDDGLLRCKLAECNIKENSIDSLVLLPEDLNIKGKTQTHPALGRIGDTEYLFFASDRDGGLGGMDIWLSRRNIDGTWQKPVNAGPQINTPGNEVSPFLCSPCHLLFFSSDGRTGMGGFDIFRAKMLDAGFSEAENMGVPFNTGYHEVNFTLSDDRKKAWFSSNRPDKKNPDQSCCNDIFSVDFPQTDDQEIITEPADTLFLLGNKITTLVPLSLFFNNDEPDRKTLNTTTNKNYKQTCEEYLKEKDNYLKAYSRGLKEGKKEKAITEMEDFFEDSVRAGIRGLEDFTNIMHDILLRGGKIEIIMKGYCSPLASTDYNINLAKRRTSSLRNYFKEWNGSALLPYMTNGTLNIKEEQIGEIKSTTQVSDNPNDQAKSVYSLSAAKERKIEIIAVSTTR